MKRTDYKPDILTAWRKSLGLSQKEFGAALGFSRPTVARMEAGHYFNLEYIISAARMCNQDYTAALTEKTLKKFAPLVSSS